MRIARTLSAPATRETPTDRPLTRSGATRVEISAAFATQRGAAELRRDPEAVLRAGEPVPGGRGEHRGLTAADWGAGVRVRPGRRGGALARLLGDRYATPARALREHALVEALHADGLPVARPVFAVAWRRGLAWRCAVATVEQSEARDLLAWLDRRPALDEQVRAARAIATALRRIHDAGVAHGDLQLRNLLLESRPGTEEPECLLIDFDRARRDRALPPAVRMREWMRLARSCEKTGHAGVLTPRVLATALAAYCDGDRALRRALLARLPAEQARLRRHRRGWRLRRALSEAADTGDAGR